MTVVSPPTVALIVSEDGLFMSRFVGGAMSVLGPLGVHVLLRPAGEPFDGALIATLDPGDDGPRRLVEAGVPVVLFGRPAEPLPISFVDIDHQAAGKLAADRLVDHGCRCIATIAGPLNLPGGHDRLAAFRAAMAHRGIAYVPCVEGRSTLASGSRAMEQLLDEVPDVDGIFVASDLMAQGALLVLRERGRRVPADIIVVGFDDSRAALASRPPLTTIRQPVEEMAAEMTTLVLRQIEHPGQAVASAIFHPTLIVRESS